MKMNNISIYTHCSSIVLQPEAVVVDGLVWLELAPALVVGVVHDVLHRVHLVQERLVGDGPRPQALLVKHRQDSSVTLGTGIEEIWRKFQKVCSYTYIPGAYIYHSFKKLIKSLHKKEKLYQILYSIKTNIIAVKLLSKQIYGSEFWTMYNWPFSDLEHFYYTWFAPSYSETISFGVVVKSTIRAFRKHILYIPLLVFVHHTCFYTFSFFWNHPVNFQAPLLILSNYSVNLVCLGPVS